MSTVLEPVATPSARPARGHGSASMVAGGLLLGTLGIFLDEAGQDALTAVWFRCLFGGFAILAWAVARRRVRLLRVGGRDLAIAAASAVLMLLNWGLFFAAIERTSIAVATVVFHVQPFWVMALGACWLKERVPARQWAAAAVALLGLALASGLLAPGAAGGDATALGVAMCLAGSLSYALVTLVARGWRGASPLALVAWQCLFGALALAAWPLAHGLPAWGAAWGWLAGLGVVHTALAYALLYAGMARIGAGRVALLQFVYPATAIVLDWLVYGRALDALQALGVALMAVALAAAARRPMR